MKDLSIIIVSYNTKDLTLDCIKSVIKHTNGINYEIIVVDNNSHDGSTEAISKLTSVYLIKNKENVGFAEANNQGVGKAQGKYVLLLNSDTKFTQDVLGHAVGFLENNHDVGIYSCKLRYDNNRVQATGGYFPTLARVMAWMLFIDDLPIFSRIFSSYHPKISFYKDSHYLDWVTGAFFLIRRELWANLSGMDKGYFMYVEEVDMCYRAKQVGIRVYYDSQKSIIHYGGKSSGSSLQIVSEYKGLRRFYKKHYPRWQMGIMRLFLKKGAILRMILFGIIKGPKYFTIYKEAYSAA